MMKQTNFRYQKHPFLDRQNNLISIIPFASTEVEFSFIQSLDGYKVESSPYMKVESSPYMKVESSPYMKVESSPYMKVESSPYMNSKRQINIKSCRALGGVSKINSLDKDNYLNKNKIKHKKGMLFSGNKQRQDYLVYENKLRNKSLKQNNNQLQRNNKYFKKCIFQSKNKRNLNIVKAGYYFPIVNSPKVQNNVSHKIPFFIKSLNHPIFKQYDLKQRPSKSKRKPFQTNIKIKKQKSAQRITRITKYYR